MKEYLAALMINPSIELLYKPRNPAFIRNVFRMFLQKNLANILENHVLVEKRTRDKLNLKFP